MKNSSHKLRGDHFSLSSRAGISLFLACALLISACQPIVSTSVLPTPQVWRVQVTPALRWMGTIFNACMRQQPQTTLLYAEKALPGLDPAAANFSFSLAPAASTGYMAGLGQVDLAIIVNPANPLTQIQASELQSIFSETMTDWASLAPADCAGCDHPQSGKIQPYIYSPGDDVGQTFSRLFPDLPLKLANAFLAPDPQAVRQAVAADPLAIGYLPSSWVDSSVRSLQITGIAPEKLKIPILFSSPAEPQANQRSWVLCVQASLNK